MPAKYSDNMTEEQTAQLLTEVKELDEAYASACGPAEAYDRDLVALVNAVREALKDRVILTWGGEELKAALEQFEPWLEQDEDPRSMGWVDDRGRP